MKKIHRVLERDQSRITLAQESCLKEGMLQLRLERGVGTSHGKMWGKTISVRRATATNKFLSHAKALHIQGTESNFLKFRIIPRSSTEAMVEG